MAGAVRGLAEDSASHPLPERRVAANVLRFMRERHASDTVVVVGHNANNRVLLLQALDRQLSEYWRLGQDPCCISEIEIAGQEMRVTRLNETCPVE